MTTYGTIQTESPPSNLDFLVHARYHIRAGLGMRRPWLEMIQFDALNFPTSFTDALQRIKTNAAFFRVNYAIIILFTLFLSLLWHPVSLVVFIITMVAWLFLYFLRDDPLRIFGKVIDDRVVMMVLLFVTIGVLFLTKVTSSIITGLSIGGVIVLIHGVLRYAEDLFLEDDEERVVSRGRDAVLHMPLKNAASNSFSSST